MINKDMKMQNVKAIFRLVIVLFIMFSIDVTTVFASNSMNEGGISEEDYNNINSALNYMGYDGDDVVYYADMQEEIDDNTKHVVLVYDDTKIIGKYVTEELDGKEGECFIVDNSSGTPEEFISVEHSDLFEIEEQVIEETAGLDGAENEDWGRLTKSAAKYLTSSATVGSFINAELIGNDTNPTTGAGLCWAACGASIVNYYKGTSYTALDMYNKVKLGTGGIPVGNTSYQKAMYGMCGLKFDYVSRRLKFDDVISTLKSGSLIKYGVSRNGGAHAVVLCGAFRISSSYGFIYMDPNVSEGYVINYNDASVANSITGNFYYYNGQVRYDNVINAFYNFKR